MLHSTELLASVDLFRHCDTAGITAIAQLTASRTYPKGAIVVNEGDPASALFVVASGQLKIYLTNAAGREYVLQRCGPGDYFGELALLDDAPRSASVMALQPCRLLALSGADFLQHMMQEPQTARQLLPQLTQRVRQLTERVRSLALGDVYERLVSVLMGMAKQHGDVWIIEDRPSHQEIANMVGASREMVSRLLRDLVTGGYVESEKRRITLLRKLPPRW